MSPSGVGLEIAQSLVRRAIDDADPPLMQTNPARDVKRVRYAE